ncbi:MAG: glycosyltransferase [Bacteroidales bacterium]|nr:glycosyltransferase [Bacteroidales bacterium]
MDQNIKNSYSKIIYLTLHNICKPTAMANRTITIVNALVDMGIEVEITTLALLDSKFKRPLDLDERISLKFYSKKRKFKLVWYVISIIRFIIDISKKDNVILYKYGYNGCFELLVRFICYVNKLSLIREITEYPGHNHKLKNFKTKCLRYSLKGTDLLFVISHALKNYFNHYISAPIIVMKMTVDLKRFSNIPNTRKNIISYCGNLYSDKDGLHNLLRAYSIFIKSTSEHYKLRLIGDISNESLIRPLKSICELEGIEDAVEFTGSVERSEIPFLLSESRMLVLCRPKNRQAEGGFPTKLGEYLASEVPVVVTDVGEISLFVKDGINGFLAENNQPTVFAKKMLEVIFDYDYAIEIGKNGKKLAANQFSAEIEINKVIPYLKNFR